MPEKDLFSLKEAAEYLGLKPETVKYHVYQSGYLKPEKIGHSLVFRREELDRFKREVPPPGRKQDKPTEDE